MVQIFSFSTFISITLLTLTSLPSISALCATVDQSKDQVGSATGMDMGPHMNIKMGNKLAADQDGKGNSMEMGYDSVRMFQGNKYPSLEELLNPTPEQLEKTLQDEAEREKEVGEHFESPFTK